MRVLAVTEKSVVVLSLALLALLVVVAGSVLAYYGQPLPGEIIAIGAGAGGALSTFIQRTNGQTVRRSGDAKDSNHRQNREPPVDER